MFCPKCGFKNSDGADYCSKCGTKLITEAAGQTTVSYTPTDDERDALVSEPQRLDHATLVLRGAGRAGETYELTSDRITIGRHPNADIFLDDVTVSRNHAIVEKAGDGFVIADEGSLNGTYLNRRRIERQVLANGDELQIGKYKLTFIAP
jgi:hypothetical protein